MADITDPTQSPSAQDDALATGNGNGAGADNRGVKRPRVSAAADDDDDDDDKTGRERRKIDIKFIQDKSRRHITFSKRKAGIMKKVRTGPFHEPLYCRIRGRECFMHPIPLSSLRLTDDIAARRMNSPS